MFLPDGQEQVMHGIAQLKELYVRLQSELRVWICTQSVLRIPGWLGGRVESFDLGPFQTHHVQRQTTPWADPLRGVEQPRLQPSAQISKSKDLARAIQQ